MATSAGLLLFRRGARGVEVLLVHPGGPYWAAKDDGAWSIPKGEHAPDEDPYAVARRELEEETGLVAPDAEPMDLGVVVQRGGKRVQAWALEGDLDPATATSNTFTMEWPPRSGVLREFPEVDRVQWCTIEEARVKLLAAQRDFLDRFAAAVPGGA